MTPFFQSSYLSQVRRLRSLAETALTRFPIRAGKIHFLNHGENTTFRVGAAGGKTYMLRVHREGYHSEPAILEELSWLKHIRQTTDLAVPAPILSRAGEYLEKVEQPGVPNPRHCAMFEWVPGKFIYRSTRPKDVFQLGKLMAQLHATAKGRKVKHRHYWDAEGLLGTTRPKFGKIDNLHGVPPAQQKIINAARAELFSFLKKFEKENPKRQGLIHADLHFGNFLVQNDRLGAIDFDDCGFGFHGYDLAVPLRHITALCKDKPRAKFLGFVDAIQDGYASVGDWNQNHVEALPYFYMARAVLMLGWLNTRLEIPSIKKDLPRVAARVVEQLKTEWRTFS